MFHSDGRIPEADVMLTALPPESDGMLSSAFRGTVTGVLFRPEMILPSEWLPRRWGGPALAVFEIDAGARRTMPFPPIRKNSRPWKADCPAAPARTETLCDTTAGRSGSDGRDTTPAAGSRQGRAASNPLASASPQASPAAQPPKSTSLLPP